MPSTPQKTVIFMEFIAHCIHPVLSFADCNKTFFGISLLSMEDKYSMIMEESSDKHSTPVCFIS